MDVKGFLLDQLGHFSPYDIPALVFAVLLAALLGLALAKFGLRSTVAEARTLAVWAALTALAFGLVRSQLPLAVGVLALVLLLRGRGEEGPDRLPLFGALLLGMGCGVSAGLVTVVIAVPVILLLRWAFADRKAGS